MVPTKKIDLNSRTFQEFFSLFPGLFVSKFQEFYRTFDEIPAPSTIFTELYE